MAATDIKTKENGNPSTEQKSSTFLRFRSWQMDCVGMVRMCCDEGEVTENLTVINDRIGSRQLGMVCTIFNVNMSSLAL